MDSRLVCTGIAVGAMIAVAVAFAGLPEKVQGIPLQQTVSGVERLESRLQLQGEYTYLLKEHQGRIGIFAAGQSEPEMVLDVLVKYLPDHDRQELSQGIAVLDYNELVSRIEDYAS